MLDSLLDLFSDKRKTQDPHQRKGVGGIFSRIQDALEGEGDDPRRSGRSHNEYRRADGDDLHDDDRDRSGSRRRRDEMEFGDD